MRHAATASATAAPERIGRGFDADDVLRISGRHLRLVVCRRDRYVEVAAPVRQRSPRA
jgi:hypothetical protein